MPVISCGGMRYQHKWQDVPPSEIPPANQANLEACIHRSIELGINHIETARGYGTSEMQLGWVLPKLRREKIIVQTKVAPQATAAKFIEVFNTSMKYLKLDHVDLLTLHGINNRELLEWSVKKDGCLDAARQLQREGRCRFVGFTTHATTQVIHDTIRTGEFDYVNLHWYFVNDLNWSCIEAATAKDMGVFIISPNDKGGKLYEPPQKLVDLCAPLTPMAFNDLFCLARPQVHTLSCGVARPSDFDAHIEALKHYDNPAAAIAPIEQRLREEMLRTLGPDWCARWWQGRRSTVRARARRAGSGNASCTPGISSPPWPTQPTTSCPARSISRKSCDCGLTQSHLISQRGVRCVTTCSVRRITGFLERMLAVRLK